MAFEPKNNTFSLFKNDYHKEGDNKPAYKGTGMFMGEKKDVAAWLKQTPDGKTYMSCKISDPYVSDKEKQTAQPQSAAEDDFDVPF